MQVSDLMSLYAVQVSVHIVQVLDLMSLYAVQVPEHVAKRSRPPPLPPLHAPMHSQQGIPSDTPVQPPLGPHGEPTRIEILYALVRGRLGDCGFHKGVQKCRWNCCCCSMLAQASVRACLLRDVC